MVAETGSGLPGHSCTLHNVKDAAPVQALMCRMHVTFTWTLNVQFLFLTAFIRRSDLASLCFQPVFFETNHHIQQIKDPLLKQGNH